MKFLFLFRTVAGSQQCSMKIYGNQLTQVPPRCWATKLSIGRGGGWRQIEIEFPMAKERFCRTLSHLATLPFGIEWALLDELLLLQIICFQHILFVCKIKAPTVSINHE